MSGTEEEAGATRTRHYAYTPHASGPFGGIERPAVYVHVIRNPAAPSLTVWRSDEHEECHVFELQPDGVFMGGTGPDPDDVLRDLVHSAIGGGPVRPVFRRLAELGPTSAGAERLREALADALPDETEGDPMQPTESALGALPRGLRTETDEDGYRWITCDALSHGDYGGYGAHGLANIRALPDCAERPEWLPDGAEHTRTDSGYYSSQSAWCLDTRENRELLAQLVDGYPSLDDDEVSRVEMEWEEEALRDYGFTEIGQALEKDFGEQWRAIWDELPDGWHTPGADPDPAPAGPSKLDVYLLARGLSNTYPEPEYNGVALHLDQMTVPVAQALYPLLVADTFGREALDQWVTDETEGALTLPAWEAFNPSFLACVSDTLADAGCNLGEFLKGYLEHLDRFQALHESK